MKYQVQMHLMKYQFALEKISKVQRLQLLASLVNYELILITSFLPKKIIIKSAHHCAFVIEYVRMRKR